jgi:hypothetical protein
MSEIKQNKNLEQNLIISPESEQEQIKQNLIITITPEQQEKYLKKLKHKRELARIRHLRWFEAHKDEIKAKRQKAKELKLLNKPVKEPKPEPKKRGRKPQTITEADIIRKLTQTH